MTVRARILLAALLATFGALTVAQAAGVVPARARATRARTVAARPVTHATAKSAAARDSARTLDPIHIEGELDVPEVLFITARDQRRIVEFQHRRYLGTAAQSLHAVPPPSRLVVDRGTPPPTAAGDPR